MKDQPAMSEKNLRNRLNILFQQLDLINLYPDEYLEKYGVKGGEENLNNILDEMIDIQNQLSEIESQKKNDEK